MLIAERHAYQLDLLSGPLSEERFGTPNVGHRIFSSDTFSSYGFHSSTEPNAWKHFNKRGWNVFGARRGTPLKFTESNLTVPQ